jgi:hypothetical protein
MTAAVALALTAAYLLAGVRQARRVYRRQYREYLAYRDTVHDDFRVLTGAVLHPTFAGWRRCLRASHGDDCGRWSAPLQGLLWLPILLGLGVAAVCRAVFFPEVKAPDYGRIKELEGDR